MSEARRAERSSVSLRTMSRFLFSFFCRLFFLFCFLPTSRSFGPSGLRAAQPPYGQAGRRSPSGRMAGGHYGHSPFGARSRPARRAVGTKKIPPMGVFRRKKYPLWAGNQNFRATNYQFLSFYFHFWRTTHFQITPHFTHFWEKLGVLSQIWERNVL